MKQHKRENARNLFVDGRSITDISKALNVTRQTVYAWKKTDREAGIDWDDLALQKAQDVSGVRTTEKEFLLTLINGFEEAIKELEELEPVKRLAAFKEYANTYYKLKAPLKSDCSAQVAQALSKLIYAIGEMALKMGADTVVEFLSENADDIIVLAQSKK